MPTPLTGTWRLRIGSIRSRSLTNDANPPNGFVYQEFTCPALTFTNDDCTNAELVAGSQDADGEKQISFDTFGIANVKFDNETSIILNEDTVDEEIIPIVSLPAGFLIQTAVLGIRGVTTDGLGTPTWSMQLFQDLTVEGTLNAGDILDDACPPSTALSASFPITAATPELLTSRILTGFGPEYIATVTAGDINNYASVIIVYIGLQGTYEIESFSFSIDTPDRTLQPGDTITVTSNPLDPAPMDFTDILTLNIITLDENQVPFGVAISIPQILWTTVTNNLWIFTLPAFLSNGIPNFITLQVTSTQFSGTVDLITAYPIYFFNAPGIYQLVPGETHDTYYDRLEDPISTIDTKIPNPFGKTGFF
jgi:hypothetical protein